MTLLYVGSTEQRTPCCACDPGVAVNNFPELHKKKLGTAQQLSVEKTEIFNIGGFFWDLRIRKIEKTLILFILVSVKDTDRSELVSDIGSFLESVPWTGKASNEHKFQVVDAIR